MNLSVSKTKRQVGYYFFPAIVLIILVLIFIISGLIIYPLWLISIIIWIVSNMSSQITASSAFREEYPRSRLNSTVFLLPLVVMYRNFSLIFLWRDARENWKKNWFYNLCFLVPPLPQPTPHARDVKILPRSHASTLSLCNTKFSFTL